MTFDPAENQTALTTLRSHVPPSMKGDVWTQLLATLGEEEQDAWNQAKNVYDQLFLVTAEGKYLDQRASEEGGYQRPELVGFSDDIFRDLVVQLSTRKLTLNAFLRVLEVYYGIDSVRAWTRTTTPEPFNVPNASTQSFMVDGQGPFVVTFRGSNFADPSTVSAIEAAVALNEQFREVGVKALALPYLDTQTGFTYLTVYAASRGLRGSVESLSGPLPLSSGRKTVQTQPRAAYVRTTGASVEVVLPATSIVVSRVPGVDSSNLQSAAADSGEGPYLHDPPNSIAITETSTATAQPLEAGRQYPSVQVVDSSAFPDSVGFVVFALGYDYQTGPVPYLGTGGAGQLLLDPSFVFTVAVPSGATVNIVERWSDEQMPHGDGDFWLTPAPAGRAACEQNVDDIAVGGRSVVKTVTYPGDIGLAGAGLPAKGVARITDAVVVWSADDTDAEVAAARSA